VIAKLVPCSIAADNYILGHVGGLSISYANLRAMHGIYQDVENPCDAKSWSRTVTASSNH
jgi:hypothetical protein